MTLTLGKLDNNCLSIYFRYLNNYLNNLFSGAWDDQDVSPLNVDIPFANHDTGKTV